MKKYFSFIVLFCFSLNIAAQPSQLGTPTPGAPAELITPENLREHLLERNFSILQSLNQVAQAKLNVSTQRMNLLPSLNLGVALSFQGDGFFLSTVSFLLPFLVPSNWFNYNESKYIFEAEKFSYYLLELNLYASAYSLIATMSADRELRKVLYTQYQNLLKIQQTIQMRFDFGIASGTDLTQAQGQTQLAYAQLSVVDALLTKEKSSLRALMAFPLSKSFELGDFSIPPSPFEDKTYEETLAYALKKSPEYAQIGQLITASKNGKWSKAFAFMNNSSLSSMSPDGRSVSFNNVNVSNQFNFGLGYFPSLELAETQIKKLELRRSEIKVEQAQIVESNIGVLSAAKMQLEQAAKAEASLNKVLQDQINNYSLGLTDLQNILLTQNTITQASTARVRAQLDLDTIRINLHRILFNDEFEKIKPCQAKPVAKQSLWKEIKDFFVNSTAQKAVDQQCKGKPKRKS
ncbi:MAG: TolC family protein [Bdellovibrionota bacterium]